LGSVLTLGIDVVPEPLPPEPQAESRAQDTHNAIRDFRNFILFFP